jgi:predicted nucleic acid-binding Zn ribbon protein
MRRRALRTLAPALRALTRELEPGTTLSRVQGCWESVAGPAVAAEAQPESERAGVVTVACRSAVWAQELDLLSQDLLESLNEAIGAPPERPAVRRLRFVSTGSRRRG